MTTIYDDVLPCPCGRKPTLEIADATCMWYRCYHASGCVEAKNGYTKEEAAKLWNTLIIALTHRVEKGETAG